MDEITLSTINSSINQLNNRMDDLNNRIDETNISLRLLITENNGAHRDINRKIDLACRLISNVDKKASITEQEVKTHLNYHKKEDERLNINGVKMTSLIGSFSCALIGSLTTLMVAGLI